MFNNKIKTGISGLDRLLYGGIQLYKMPNNEDNEDKTKFRSLTIVISGKSGTYRTLFGMQLLRGLTISLQREFPLYVDLMKQKRDTSEENENKKEKDEDDKQKNVDIYENEELLKLGNPIFLSFRKHEQNLSDIILDMVISKCVQKIIRNNLTNSNKFTEAKFSSAIFKLEPYESIGHFSFTEMDKYIGEEVVIYNNRTNALHFTASYKPHNEKEFLLEPDDMIAYRKYDNMSAYVNKLKVQEKLPPDLAVEFFDIEIVQLLKEKTDKKKDEYKKKCEDKINSSFSKNQDFIPCLVVDDYNQYKELILTENKPLITIFLENNEEKAKEINPDVWIDLRTYEYDDVDYLINQIAIKKAILQNAALGWHQYKNRDHGIEVFPSTHFLLQRRRHIPKAISRANVDILSDTFQQYIDNNVSEIKNDNSFKTNITDAYKEYQQNKKEKALDRLNNIYKALSKDLHTSSVLGEILVETEIDGTSTAIIGAANSYKRFLSLAKTFSASFQNKHTLYILLDQDSEKLRRSMICPTWEYRYAKSGKSIKNFIEGKESAQESEALNCRDCYACIHFWDIRMGNITSDEFFYYFTQQLETQSNIKQVIIDNIQKITYSFPLLKKDKLFLTTLVSICKDYKKDLVILCDRSSRFVNELRTLADNVICTERSDKETQIYIEQYVGYNAPSHIYACKVKKMEELFYCSTYQNICQYCLNENRIENLDIHNMDEYWMNNNIKTLIRSLKKK